MKNPDKFLVGMVVGIVVLVVAAVVVTLARPAPAYLPDDTAEGVVHNYFFALQQRDYERAYGYLSPSLKGYPRNAEVFADEVLTDKWTFQNLWEGNVTLNALPAVLSDSGQRANVTVQAAQFSRGGLFGNNEQQHTFSVDLKFDNSWKITHADKLWVWCWSEGDCP